MGRQGVCRTSLVPYRVSLSSPKSADQVGHIPIKDSLALILASFLTGVHRITSITRLITVYHCLTGGGCCVTGKVPVGFWGLDKL